MNINPRERRNDQNSSASIPDELRQQVFGGLVYAATPLAPIAAFLLWRQFQAAGNLASLWMATAYALLSLALLTSVIALARKRVDLAINAFAYPGAVMLSFQISVSPSVLMAVTITEMLLLASICFVVMESTCFKRFFSVQILLAALFLTGRFLVTPAPLVFPAWDIFNREVVPLAIFLVFQLALVFITLQLKSLLGKNAQVLASLQAQREELARKNDDLRLFFYAASHDLRQPLRQVSGFAKLLEQNHHASLANEAKEYLGFIEQVAGRMEGLLDSLLAYSSLGAKPIELAAVDLGQTLQDAAQDLRLDIEKFKVEIDFGPMPTVQGQASLLEDVFKNLFENCIKYRQPEKVLTLKVLAQEQVQGWQIAVEDNGIGVPPSVRAGLFKVFHRGHPPAHYPGYGIGLAYCRRVLEMHGGWIRLGEKTGDGTRIELFLPRVVPAYTGADGSPDLSAH